MLYFLGTLKKIDELKGKFRDDGNTRSQLDKRLRDAFREIIDGKTVKRSKHELVFGGIDVSNVFVDEMNKRDYLPMPSATLRAAKGNAFPHFMSKNCMRILAGCSGKNSPRAACANSLAAL